MGVTGTARHRTGHWANPSYHLNEEGNREHIGKPACRWDIDWLRVLATLLLFYIHPARILLSMGPFYIKNDQLSILP